MSNILNINDKILECIMVLNKKTKIKKSGGNCGQFAYAIHRYILDKYDYTIDIGVLTDSDANVPEDLLGDYDIMHIFLMDGDNLYDDTGMIDYDYLFLFAHTHYKHEDVDTFHFDMEDIEDKKLLLRVISANTNYTMDWNFFYNILENNKV